MKHRFVRRVSALALAGCLLAGSSLPAFAAASAAKEEVIYANLTASGAVTGVYAVNSFSVQAGDTVADHGSYTAVRNMTTSDAVEQSGDTVTVHVTEDGIFCWVCSPSSSLQPSPLLLFSSSVGVCSSME